MARQSSNRTSHPDSQPHVAPERVRTAQTALNSLGYPVGSEEDAQRGVTGEWNEQTRLAVLEFQEEFGLVLTGALDDETFEIIVGATENSPVERAPQQPSTARKRSESVPQRDAAGKPLH